MSDMSNDRPIPVETEGHFPDDTEGHLAMFKASDAPEADDTEGHLKALDAPQVGEAPEDDTEGHFHLSFKTREVAGEQTDGGEEPKQS
jgi:hypothetical protein